MKKVIITILMIATILSQPIKNVNAENIPYNTVVYDGEVRHFFTHELIYSPEKAFSKQNFLRYNFDKDHLTTVEFVNFLDKMRQNDYVLVDFDMLYTLIDGKMVKNKLFLPVGKKPFTLSIDDMSYDTDNRGIINKIIVDEDGNLKDYTDVEDEKITSSRESITILENYLSIYPDFSINNSKICICVNGYNGILGYRVQKGNKNRESEIIELKKVVETLKNKGYTFACHTYSHAFINTLTPSMLVNDLTKWNDEIGCLLGECSIFCFPGGIHNAMTYNDVIIRNKFNMLLCVGMDTNRKGENSTNYVYIYRTALDGNSLRTYPNMYRDIFEPSEIYDNNSRFIKYFKV